MNKPVKEYAEKSPMPPDNYRCPKCGSKFPKPGKGICPLGCTEKRETAPGVVVSKMEIVHIEKIPYKLVLIDG
ncbi:MAG: hypothetical protein WC364_04805 [Eubacteriales bacterium]|jgi:uncharacterized Zn finger protein (UPF0148 family)